MVILKTRFTRRLLRALPGELRFADHGQNLGPVSQGMSCIGDLL